MLTLDLCTYFVECNTQFRHWHWIEAYILNGKSNHSLRNNPYVNLMAHLRTPEQRAMLDRRGKCGNEKAYLLACYCSPLEDKMQIQSQFTYSSSRFDSNLTLLKPTHKPKGCWRKLMNYYDSWSISCAPKP